MTYTHNKMSPTSSGERIISIDVLRGVAVLGILIMNIQSFSMISAAYINPAAYGDLSGINKWVWIGSHILADNKFMSIFSMLFGAGLIIFTSRAIEKDKKPWLLFYRRMFWLLIFGLLHAYLIWYGDILTTYALCGFLVFLFRKMKPKKLLIYASIFFLIPFLFNIMAGLSIPTWPESQYNESVSSWLPAHEAIQKELATYQGGFLEQMSTRVNMAIFLQTFLFFYSTLWTVTAMMLLGMALYKLDVFSAKRSKRFYLRLSLPGFLIGLLLSGFGVYQNFKADWYYDFAMFFGSQFNYIGSVAMALGYIGVVMLICKSNRFGGFKYVMSSVGKMAFTNYILMSIIAMFIFYGNGMGLFGQVERWEQLLFVVGIWVFIIVISPLWLKYFYFGPLEWLWRVLTYWKIQPLRKT